MNPLDKLLRKILTPRVHRIYAVLRIITGVLLVFHGLQKIFGVLSDREFEVMSQLWIGGLIELVGGALIAVGLFTRTAAFLASGMMAVAYIQFHWKFQFGAEFFPGVNQGELAVVYCFLLLFIAAKGVGVWGLDRRGS